MTDHSQVKREYPRDHPERSGDSQEFNRKKRKRSDNEKDDDDGDGDERNPTELSPKRPKVEPNYVPSGILEKAEQKAEEAVSGISSVYQEPPDSKMPSSEWYLFVFKSDQQLERISLSKKSYHLLGRDRRLVDIPLDHPSCSKQHAVIQFRGVEKEGRKSVVPYIIDLGSTNGTKLADNKIRSKRYVELLHQDVIQFGFSTREYVLVSDSSM